MEGYYGILPDELTNEIFIFNDIPMECVIEVWKKVVFYQKNL